MAYPKTEDGRCESCGRTDEEVASKGHIMGCAWRTRQAAIAHYEYDQSLLNVVRKLYWPENLN